MKVRSVFAVLGGIVACASAVAPVCEAKSADVSPEAVKSFSLFS